MWPERTASLPAALGRPAWISLLTCMSSWSSAPQRRYSSSVIVQRRTHYLSHHSHSLTGPFSWEIKACCLTGRRADSQHKPRLTQDVKDGFQSVWFSGSLFHLCRFHYLILSSGVCVSENISSSYWHRALTCICACSASVCQNHTMSICHLRLKSESQPELLS